MDMDMHMSATTTSTPIPSGTQAHYMSSMDAMSGMASTFSINTHVTLWFTEWTTDSPAAYAFTVIFLFCLGIFNRFLGAFKTQLERRWKERPREERIVSAQRNTASGIRRHVRRWSEALLPKSPRLDDRDCEEMEPLSPLPPHPSSNVDEKRTHPSNIRRFWIPSSAWSFKKDSIRALLEFTRALVGYILMLAVMTYNVGFFFAVTGSVLLGEMFFGRYTHSNGWQEGGCHE